MNRIELHRGSEVIETFESSYVPQIGETIWLDSSMQGAEYVKIVGKVLDLDKSRRRLTIKLIVE